MLPHLRHHHRTASPHLPQAGPPPIEEDESPNEGTELLWAQWGMTPEDLLTFESQQALTNHLLTLYIHRQGPEEEIPPALCLRAISESAALWKLRDEILRDRHPAIRTRR